MRAPALVTGALATAALALTSCGGAHHSGDPSSSSSSASPTVVTFDHITQATAGNLRAAMPSLHGISNVTYNQDAKTLTVDYTPEASNADRTAVKELVEPRPSP